jgi:glucose-6-phosphate 1-dehydrogenase
VRFRPLERRPFGPDARELRIGLDGPLDVALQLIGSAPGSRPAPAPLTLASAPNKGELPPYARVLLDVLNGDGTLSVREDEAEQAWRIVTPILDAWAEGRVAINEYPAGSDGPPPVGWSRHRSSLPAALAPLAYSGRPTRPRHADCDVAWRVDGSA